MMIKKQLIAFGVLLIVTIPTYAVDQVTTLKVDGMTCASCPYQVKKALTGVEGVKEAIVEIETREALVTYDDSQTNLVELTEATANAGFPSTVKATN